VNGLSISRLIVSVPTVLALLRNDPLGDRIALLLMFWALSSDIADGYFARRTGVRSRLGAVLDPLADKVLIGCIVMTLVLVRSLPFWAAGIILLRDACILVAGGWFARRKGIVLESNHLGKITGVVFACMIGLYTLRLETAGLYLAVLSVGLVLLSSLSYSLRLLRLLRGR